MKKYKIFYVLDLIWIFSFFLKAFMENSASKTGLAALESLGDFVLYCGLGILGILVLIIVIIIHVISIKRGNINK